MRPFRLPWRHRPVDARSLESLVTEGFVAIDLETTGLDPKHDAIIELAAIRFVDGRPEHVFVTHVDPGRSIRPESSRIHGITDDMVAGAPPIGEVLLNLGRVLAGHALVGHGIGFDLAVLGRECRAHGLTPISNPAVDTKLLTAGLHPEWEALHLEDIAALAGIGILGRHTAEGDARAVGELLLALLPEVRDRGIRTVSDLIWFQETVARGR